MEQKCVDQTYHLVGIRNEAIVISKNPLNVAFQKIEAKSSLFLWVILTSKNEKLFESSVSKVNFIFLCFEFK